MFMHFPDKGAALEYCKAEIATLENMYIGHEALEKINILLERI